jgi:hypothetical protein
MGSITMALFANVSMDLTKFKELLQANPNHSAFTKHSNGRMYVNLTIWENDEVDNYGKNVSIQVNSKKEQRDVEGKHYVGNGKKSGTPTMQASSPAQAPIATSTELPF